MAVARRQKNTEEKKPGIFDDIKKEVGSVVLVALAILIWWNISFPPDGKIGILFNQLFKLAFGSLAGIFPFILLLGSFGVMFSNPFGLSRGVEPSV